MYASRPGVFSPSPSQTTFMSCASLCVYHQAYIPSVMKLRMMYLMMPRFSETKATPFMRGACYKDCIRLAEGPGSLPRIFQKRSLPARPRRARFAKVRASLTHKARVRRVSRLDAGPPAFLNEGSSRMGAQGVRTTKTDGTSPATGS